jgi:hypothetical protein
MRAPPTAASLQPPGGGGFYPTIYEVPRDEDDPLAGYSEYLAWGNVFNAVLIILCAIYGLIVKFESSQSVEGQPVIASAQLPAASDRRSLLSQTFPSPSCAHT